jgi:anti-sigma B factor antagonist
MKSIKVSDHEALIIPEGRIDITNSQDLKQKMLELYDEDIKHITLDFTNVTTIDSSGLGKLLLFQKKLKERNGGLKIINITSDYVSKMFKMIHLHKAINIED